METKELLDYQISLPSYIPETAWLRHGPFAMWLIAAARPKRIVELGTHLGFSYFAFCEAVKAAKLDTECFAIDTWKGDEHSGFYGDNVFEAVNAENIKYSKFSKLLRKTFDEAIGDFEDGSIDILHVDGRHFYEDVKSDYESWIPKLAADAIVLFHDTEVYERDFGVWKYWAELSVSHQTLNFPYQHGLGVLFRGGDLSPELRWFREAASTHTGRDMLISTFYAAGEVMARTVGFNAAMAESNEKQAQLSAALETEKLTAEKLAAERVAPYETENSALRHELAYVRSRPKRVLKEYLAYKVLTAASNTPLPINDYTRERFAQSARKRAPNRHLLQEASDQKKQPRKKKSVFLKKVEITLLREFSRLTSSVSPRQSAKFIRSAEKRERRLAEPEFIAAALEVQSLPTIVESHTFCSRPLSTEADVLILVLFSGDGRLSDLHRYQIALYREAGFSLVLVINTPLHIVASTLLKGDPVLDEVVIAIIRDNRGFDFGAWAHALKVVGQLDAHRSLSFTNDSIVPLDSKSLSNLRNRIAEASGAVFMTQNKEVRPHYQSYFFGFGKPTTEALDLLRDVKLFDDKEKLIQEVEVHLSDRLRDQGIEIELLFPLDEADEQGRNPTIHFWRNLIERGFPFLKVQLFSSGLLEPTDHEVEKLIGAQGVRMLNSHLSTRNVLSTMPELEINQPPVPALPINTRYSKIAALQAYNPPADARPSIVLPLEDTTSVHCAEKRVLVVMHAFYIDIAEAMVKRLGDLQKAGCGASFRFVLTTDSDEKAQSLKSNISCFLSAETDFQIVVGPNRGRDVAPFLKVCAEHLTEADDLVLHLHTKKSPHDSSLSGWGEYLFDCLAGSSELVRSTMQLFDEPTLGIIYPGHYKALNGLRNWGYDFPHARTLMQRMGYNLRADDVLDFPTGTMFWARPAALQPLIALRISPEDFELEVGQTDGTLAHAIERILVHVAESAGYKVLPVVAENVRENHVGTEFSMTVSNAKALIARIQANLRHFARPRSNFSNAIREVYEVSTGRSDNCRPRLNVLLPTVQPEKVFGGVATALRVANKLWNAHGDIDLRILITSDKTDISGLNEVSRRISRNFTLSAPEDDGEGTTVVSVQHQPFRALSLRANDYFLSTAWWTADLGFRLLDAQFDLFGATQRMAYLIQDYEPGFYKWSNQYAMAMNTYGRPDDTIALINSEELATFISRRHELSSAFCLPYALEPRLSESLRPTRKEKIILVYGRPSVERNAFEIIVEGLRRWQLFVPEEAKSWQIIMAGEAFAPELISELENASVVGKLSMSEYSDLLNRAGVGVSLMLSPHPSYPPLEMASAGVLTVTNLFEDKDLSKRASNITSISTASPEAIARAVEGLTAEIDTQSLSGLVSIAGLPSPYPLIDFNAVARLQCKKGGGSLK